MISMEDHMEAVEAFAAYLQKKTGIDDVIRIVDSYRKQLGETRRAQQQVLLERIIRDADVADAELALQKLKEIIDAVV